MQPITVVVGPLATANTTIVADAQSVNAATNLTLVSSPVVLDTARQIQLASDADETGTNFTIYGTTYSGQPISEILAGPNATSANTILDFATVTQIATSNATAGNVTVGTSNVAHSRWVRMDGFANAQSAVQVSTDGVVTYTVETTMDDPNSATNPVAPVDVNWVNAPVAALVSANSTVSASLTTTPTFVRLAVTSGNGTATMTIVQFGNAPY